MDADTFKMLLESGEQAKLHAAARSLGRNLAAWTAGDWLLNARRVTARLQKRATSDYERGFLEALELVTSGFDRQVTEARADESDLVRIKRRTHWLPTLRILESGAHRPSDLAKQLGIGKSHATKLLDDLEEAELITRVPEGKERPCLLTSRARILLEKLPEEKMPPLEEIVPVIVDCMGTISRDRRIGRQRLLAKMELTMNTKVAPRVLDVFAKSLQDSELGFLDDDDALVATEAELYARLAHQLTLACAGQRTPLLDRLSELDRECDIILRVPSGSFEWDVITQKHLKRAQVFTDIDLEMSEVPSSPKKYLIVYGSPGLLNDDLRRGRRAIADNAHGRYYFGIDTTLPIQNFSCIKIPTPDTRGVLQHAH